ncbi:MAG: DUF4368 domain-containing protein, partial [Clostridiales bacterium]|nr:DUF4368 domain-containing protein [Clostridiales bacterium]
EMREQIDAWSEDKLKTERFIDLVKRYTDFSELTTPMLNEFIEKVVVFDGDKRGADRRQRVDIYMNFIGAFELPADFITPMEIEEQRRQEEEKAVKDAKSHELYQIRYERRLQEAREFTARKKAGLLTPEELEADERYRAGRREWQKEWRDKRQAELPPKPPKPLSLSEIAERRRAGLPLTPEEIERHDAYKKRKNEQFKKWREKQKAVQSPKPPKAKKPTKKEIMTGIISRKNAGLPLTPEELEAYTLHRETCNEKHKIWRDAKAADNTQKLTIEDIKKRRRDGLPLTQEESATLDSWIQKKNEYRRELYQKQKAGLAEAVGQ